MRSLALVKELDSAGYLPAEFGEMFRQVPRELFVPDRVWVKFNGAYQPIDRHTDPERWFSSVYSNRSVVTQFDDGRTEWPQVGDRPTCSASMPSVVAAMLAILGVERGDVVLEVGTGTGFNAALLGELVGPDGRVSTVEVDPGLMAAARAHLADTVYTGVRTLLGDGALGDPETAPFDKVIATATVHLGRVPYAWIEQTRPGGVILAPVRADLASGPLVRYVVNDDGTATGRTAPISVGFMELRAQRTPTTADDDRVPWDDDRAEVTTTAIDAATVLTNPAARWALAVSLPSCRYDIEDGTDERPGDLVWLRDPLSGSWASVAPGAGEHVVRQFGPRRLWDEAASAYRWWVRQRQPALAAWKWTITPDRQSVTLDP